MNALGTAQVIRANARDLPLADNSVDLVVTSPPYFALRSYTDAGEHYSGQIGDEPTPAEFVDALLEVTRECVRVLKPSGSLWVNLGDKYATYAGNRSSGRTSLQGSTDRCRPVVPRKAGLDGGGAVKAKSLMGIPWRYALACIDDLGLILRAEVIWSKPNGLPESVTDRVRRSHEQWFHFTLEPRYFSALDEIREEYAPASIKRFETPLQPRTSARGMPGETREAFQPHQGASPLGKLPGSVWQIPTEPLRVPDHLGIDHFAAYPTEWPRRIIQGWSPAGVCVECGEGRRPVVAKDVADFAGYRGTNGHRQAGKDVTAAAAGMDRAGAPVFSTLATITGYTCACPEPTADTTPATVLDPFGGTGTTALVAKALGRHGITIDMSNDYCRLARWRTNDRNQLAKVLGIEKAPVADVEQVDLFGEATA